MFCSAECKATAKAYHSYECEIIEDLLMTGIAHIVLRMFLKGIALFGSFDELSAFLKQNENSKCTVFEGNYKDPKQQFLITFGLANSTEKFSLDVYQKIFMKDSRLQQLWTLNRDDVCWILQKLIQVGNHYVHGIGLWSLNENGMEKFNDPINPAQHQQLVGNGCYLFCSLLNHSCAPNIRRLNVEDKVVIVVIRPIQKGEQIFDSYRLNFNIQSKAERQESLKKDYGFSCDCEACVGDYPMNQNLASISESLLEYAWEAHENLPFMNAESAKQKLHEYCNVIMKHSKRFPSAELIILQECISNCLVAMSKPALQFS